MALICLIAFALPASSQERSRAARSVLLQSPLSSLKDKRRALILIGKNPFFYADDVEDSIIEEAYRADPKDSQEVDYRSYAVMAYHLNRHIRERRSMTAVERMAEADIVLYFNLLEYREWLTGHYPYGELYVILTSGDGSAERPRVVWRTKKVMMAVDAIKAFIRDLRRARGEK